MTVIEVLVVIACVVILVAVLLPPRHVPDRSFRTRCMNNLKQIGLGFFIYADDNHGKFPIRVPITNGGTMDFLDRSQTFPHYQKLSANTNLLRALVCPVDKFRRVATDFGTLTDTNISYFLNADVSTNNSSQSVMSGDRYLQANGQPVKHGTLLLSPKMEVSWTPDSHRGRGGLGFADGHAEFCRSTDLNAAFQREGLSSARLSVP